VIVGNNQLILQRFSQTGTFLGFVDGAAMRRIISRDICASIYVPPLLVRVQAFHRAMKIALAVPGCSAKNL
jgi:hypothetical protein